jgi:hypothetical protein
VVADGDIGDAEIECLDRLAVHEQIGLARQELHALLDTFCEDLLSSDQLKWAGACSMDKRTLAGLMGIPCRHGAASGRRGLRPTASGRHVAAMHIIANLN